LLHRFELCLVVADDDEHVDELDQSRGELGTRRKQLGPLAARRRRCRSFVTRIN
jgi:hypothetical protein